MTTIQGEVVFDCSVFVVRQLSGIIHQRNITLLVPSMSQMNPVQTFTHKFDLAYLILILKEI
jgi:hypothetical protein